MAAEQAPNGLVLVVPVVNVYPPGGLEVKLFLAYIAATVLLV